MPLEHIFTTSNADEGDWSWAVRNRAAALNGAQREGEKAAALPLFCHCQSLGKLCHPLSLHVLSYPSTGGSKIFSSSRYPAMLLGHLSCCPGCGGRVDSFLILYLASINGVWGAQQKAESFVIYLYLKHGCMFLKELQKHAGHQGLFPSSTHPSHNILLGLFQEPPDSKAKER